MVSAMFSLVLYACALVTAWVIDFHKEFVRTEAIYLGHFGFAWVGAWLGWASQNVRRIPSEIRGVVLVPDAAFNDVVRSGLDRIYDYRFHLLGVLPGILASWAFVWFGTRSDLLVWLPESWSCSPHLLVKNLILAVFYVVPVALLIHTGAVGIVAYARFLDEVTHLPLHPMMELTRAKLRPITDLGLATGLAWSVGVSLFILLFREDFDALTISLVIILTIMGMIMMVWPQLVAHRALAVTRNSLLDLALERSTAQLRMGSMQDWDHLQGVLLKQSDLKEYVEWLENARTWIYEPGDMLSFVTTWLIPVATFALTLMGNGD